jgi:hypothetical protein
MDRKVDVTGISGTGIIRYLAEVDSGVIMLWDSHDEWDTVEWITDMHTVIDIHGHEGKTVFYRVNSEDEVAARGKKLLARRLPDLMHTLGDLWEG